MDAFGKRKRWLMLQIFSLWRLRAIPAWNMTGTCEAHASLVLAGEKSRSGWIIIYTRYTIIKQYTIYGYIGVCMIDVYAHLLILQQSIGVYIVFSLCPSRLLIIRFTVSIRPCVCVGHELHRDDQLWFQRNKTETKYKRVNNIVYLYENIQIMQGRHLPVHIVIAHGRFEHSC